MEFVKKISNIFKAIMLIIFIGIPTAIFYIIARILLW